jgi:putative ABC transport system permease protein
MLHDWRLALRFVIRRRTLPLAILLTLAISIAATSVTFAALHAVLLRPLPYPDSQRLVSLYEARVGHEQETNLLAPARLDDGMHGARTFDGMAASYFESATDSTGAMPERVLAMRRHAGVLHGARQAGGSRAARRVMTP